MLMEIIVKFIQNLIFPARKKVAKNFFDYPAKERKRILRAAGRAAQKEQNTLIELAMKIAD